MVKKQFRLTEDSEGGHVVTYLEYDDAGTLVTSEEYPFEPSNGEDVRSWFDDAVGSSTAGDTLTRKDGRFDYNINDTPEEIALAQTANQTADELVASNLVAVATSGRGSTRIMTPEGFSAKGGPIKSGDPNVSDAARKRQDGAAEPKLEAIDLNQPAQPIAGAPRGGAVLQSQLGGVREVLENAPVQTLGEKAIEAGATPEQAGYSEAEMQQSSDSAEDSILPDYGQSGEEKDKSAEKGEEAGSSVEVKSQTGKGTESPKNVD